MLWELHVDAQLMNATDSFKRWLTLNGSTQPIRNVQHCTPTAPPHTCWSTIYLWVFLKVKKASSNMWIWRILYHRRSLKDCPNVQDPPNSSLCRIWRVLDIGTSEIWGSKFVKDVSQVPAILCLEAKWVFLKMASLVNDAVRKDGKRIRWNERIANSW